MTDALKFIGALSVVWYHNPFYWNLDKYTEAVDIGKLIFIGWSMPFFYATTIKFGLSITPKKIYQKLQALLKLICIYTLIYEAVRIFNADSVYANCIQNHVKCSIGFFIDKFRSVNDTPGYYLSDMVSIFLIIPIFFIGKYVSLIAFVCLLISIFFGAQRLFGVFLNPLVVGCFVTALMYKVIAPQLFESIKKKSLGQLQGGIFIIFLLGTWGTLNLFYTHNNYWQTGLGSFFVFEFLLLVIISLDSMFIAEGIFFDFLSQCGQKYSFGIFIFHQLCFDVCSPIIRRLLSIFLIQNNLVIFLIVGTFISLITIALTILIEKIFPYILRT